MTQEDITRMAREAGFVGMDGEHGALRRFAALVAAAEREACAKLAQKTVCDTRLPLGIKTPQELFFSLCLSIGFVIALIIVMVLMTV